MIHHRKTSAAPADLPRHRRLTRRELLALTALGIGGVPPVQAQPSGQLIWGVHISLAPAWFDPGEASGLITPFLLLYAMHDAVIKPIPGKPVGLSLAESQTISPDGLTYEFQLRAGAIFHDGDSVTAEDVKFSFERYRGNARQLLKDKVAEVSVLDPQHVRFRLHKPWPDFLTYYGAVTGAGWVVPKKYIERVGEDAFRKAPVGAGPYKFVSFTPGVELVMEAFEGYWRRAPTVKKLIFKVIPDEATRLAALRNNEVDFAYSIRGELAEQLKRVPGLTLKPVIISSPFWLAFPDQWDPKSPWHNQLVRRATGLALDHKGISEALTLGQSPITNSIIPRGFEFYWQPPPALYDPAKARALLAEAGFRNGFDAGEYFCDSSYANLGEAIVNNLTEVGIRVKMRPIERAAFLTGYAEKKYRNVVQTGSGAFGNAATRLESWIVKGGAYVYGSYPDLDLLYADQAAEIDVGKRTAILHRMQQFVHERAIVAPIWQLAFINAEGPRIANSALGLIEGHPYAAPYEEVRLRSAQ